MDDESIQRGNARIAQYRGCIYSDKDDVATGHSATVLGQPCIWALLSRPCEQSVRGISPIIRFLCSERLQQIYTVSSQDEERQTRIRGALDEAQSGAPAGGEAVRDRCSAGEVFQRIVASAEEEMESSNRELFFSGIAAGSQSR